MPLTDCDRSPLVAAYAALVRVRRSCRACPGLINPADCDGGIHDSDQIGPWTLWQGNLRADLVIVGQDWGDTRYFIANAAGTRATTRPTRICGCCYGPSVSRSLRPGSREH